MESKNRQLEMERNEEAQKRAHLQSQWSEDKRLFDKERAEMSIQIGHLESSKESLQANLQMNEQKQ